MFQLFHTHMTSYYSAYVCSAKHHVYVVLFVILFDHFRCPLASERPPPHGQGYLDCDGRC